MPVVVRHDYINSFHHVYSRGLDRFAIFRDNQDRYKFLECITSAQKKYGFKIHAYCLMDNHYHLYLQSVRGNLSLAMQSINLRYSIYHNLKYKRKGTIYESRFNSKLVQSEKYSLNIIRYIHRNPLEAKMVLRLEDYYWSSYPIYIGTKEPDSFFELFYISSQFDQKAFAKSFKYFHRKDDCSYDFFDSSLVYGDDNFIKQILGPAIVKPYQETVHHDYYEEELMSVLYDLIQNYEGLNSKERLWLYVFVLRDMTSLKYREIAELLGLGNDDALKQINYRFRKKYLCLEKFASIYSDLKVVKDEITAKCYGVTTRC